MCVYKHRVFRNNNRKVPQKLFHTHYCLNGHSGIKGWDFVIFEQSETHAQLKERETFWQHRLKIFYPIRLNEKEEYLYWPSRCRHLSHAIIWHNFGGKKAGDVDLTCSIFYDSMGWGITHPFFLRGGNCCLPQHRRDRFSVITITPMGVGKP